MQDINKKEFERLLKNNGFSYDRSGKHHVWKHQDGRMVTVPMGSTTINACIARKAVKENRLEGAPCGWSDLWKKADALEEAAQKQRREQEEQRQREQAEREEQEKEAERKRRKADEERRRREQKQIDADDANREALEKARQAIVKDEPEPKREKEPTCNTTTSKTTLYMNEKRLESFHEYLCAVVDYYHKNGKILKNFSSLAKQYRVKGITQDDFKNYKLGELKPGEKPSRKLSDTIRLTMAEQDRQERERMLAAYQKERDEKEAAAEQQQEPEREPTLEERIDIFEARFDLLGPVFANISSQLDEYYKKEFGPNAEELMGKDSWRVRLSPYQYLMEWANNVEFDLTRLVFDDADPEEVKKLLPKWNEKIMHAYLTWLYGGKDGNQLKLDFDERGREDSQNEQLIDLLRGQGLLEETIFAKLESWKGCAHCVVVYKDAPDILMVIGENGVDFYTIADDIWYSFQGNTVINPDVCAEFGGWGTRSIVGYCLKQIISEDNHKAALKEQKNVTKQMSGKLMNDINNYRDIWQMYHDEYEKQMRKGMVDFS